MGFYKMQIKAHNATAHHILKNEVNLILTKFYGDRKIKEEFQHYYHRFYKISF